MDLDKYFKKGDLIPAIIQEDSTGEVLMLAYMNRDSMQKRLKRGTPGFGRVLAGSFGTRAQLRVISKNS